MNICASELEIEQLNILYNEPINAQLIDKLLYCFSINCAFVGSLYKIIKTDGTNVKMTEYLVGIKDTVLRQMT